MKEISKEIIGTVQGHRDGHGFVVPEDGSPDLYLPPNEMRAVLHRDRVKARIAGYDRKGRPEGRVVEIVERSSQPLIGRLLQENGIWLLAPEDKRYGQDVILPKDALANAQPGQVVVVELTEPPALYGQPVGRVTEVLGDMDDPGMEIEIAVRKYGVPHVFSDACLRLAKALPATVQDEDWQDRVDLTDVPLVTIDGEDARDFDDAVYCEPAVLGSRGKSAKTGWRLLVAIADVSHYVQNGNAIDVDAYERATSVYFPRRVIPMLPEKLSNGLCSLNPDVDRLCMVCDMLITADGDIHAYQFYPGVMHSHARFTYTEVAAILSNTKGPEARKYAARVDDLLHLHGVFKALHGARERRGAMDLETVETQIVCDENGRIEKIVPRIRNDAHKLIEEAMLAANVCAADFITRGKQPGLFRVHEGPTLEKVEILRNYLRTLGINAQVSDQPTPGELAAIAEATKDRPDAEQVHAMLLRSMQQAIYSPHNSGHFGLAYEAYAHFTSPIRRYPDLLVHRVIKAILRGEKYHLPVLPTPGEAQAKLSQRLQKNAALRAPNAAATATAKPRKNQAELQAWEAAGLHCSANERRADEASRDVETWLKCKYLRDFLGEEFNGVVSSVTSFGLFVTLDAMYVEGLVHITELGGDYFKFDEARQELRGERTGLRFALGAKVQVQVIRVDLDGRRIDFRLLRAGQDALQQAAASKAAGKKRASGKRTSRPSAENDDASLDAMMEASANAFAPEEIIWQAQPPRARRSSSRQEGSQASRSSGRSAKTAAASPSRNKLSATSQDSAKTGKRTAAASKKRSKR
ncbi:MAG: ribonuclease R [Brachymonas sp.]|nr:ribonuclease R [Brachymonas sp.]